MTFFNKDIDLVFKELNSSEEGLSSFDAESRLKEQGENKLDKQKPISFFKRLASQFKNIMIIILVLSAIISLVTAISQKDYENIFEGVLIFVIVLVNAIVGVIQEQKAEDALSALASSAEPFATVIRGGMQSKIKVHSLVVGDIVLLKTGDCVPADIRLISSNNLKCNESSLTGESLSISKHAKTLHKNNLQITDQENMCFSGTNITSGSAKGIVTATGKNTELGKIAKILSSSIKEKTPLEKNIDRIGKVLTISILFIVMIVFFVQLFFNKQLSFLDSLLTAVTLAVAAIPESLPAVITIIMALGVQKLARKNAIIKKLSAVETLGSCNIICTDKTGTLTKNEMTVKHVYYSLHTQTAEETILSKNSPFVLVSSLANNSVIQNNKVIADATETAITKFLISKDIDILKLKLQHKKVAESEFNSSKKLMTVVCKNKEQKTLYAKGAIDYLIESCSAVQIGESVKTLTPEIKHKILSANEKICMNGERVIAFAYSPTAEENNLVFVGFVGIIDPPRKEVFGAIKECKKAGLKTVMITGDHPATAFSIAKNLGIATSKKEILTGSTLSTLTQKELNKIICNYSVFARVTPEHKLMIVNALKSNGNIVAMTGDGVNDAPSIKHANIGAAMGITGTDVTKEVADIIITDDNFATLVVAIKEGRTIYQNISKTILFLLSTNIVEVLGIFITSLIMPDAVFLLPTQILFINLVTDSLPAFALGIEGPEKNIMQKPPRDPKKSLLSGSLGSSIIYQGFVQTLIVLIMFVFARHFHGNAVASTMSFLTICLMQVIHAVNCKTEQSIFKTNLFKNKFFNFSFVFLIGLILMVYFTPALASLFGLVSISSTMWLVVCLTSLAIIPLVELGKIFIK